tara:strand:- start:34 stop:780 length:747 start_codon:yes stop_codon:yes gene_type:complete
VKSLFDLIGNYYDLIYSEKNYSEEASFVLEILKKYKIEGKSLLELGSGTGIHATELAKKGYFVQGIERSQSMLLRSKKHNRYKVINGDIRDFSLERKFDSVISLFHVISYQIKNEDLDSVLNNVGKHLNKGGLFLFDFWYSPAVYNLKPKVRLKRFHSENYIITRISEPQIISEANRVDVEFTFFVENKKDNSIEKFVEIHPMRHFSLPEIELFALKHDFKLLKSGEWLTNKLPTDKTWGVYSILEKL